MTDTNNDDLEQAEDLDYEYHALAETKDEVGHPGVSVRHMLIIEAVRGLCSGPLGTLFANHPGQLGAFAAKIADGVESVRFDANLLPRQGQPEKAA
ncbi:MAG: hypothetical protein JF606_25300 [Burkholderiales bacterium]|jgi:hypothetical protein|nr:hypothetical protein [Burkholderiales bacterium]